MTHLEGGLTTGGRSSLVPTDALWACGTCGYAITQTALLMEEIRCPAKGQLSRRPSQSLMRKDRFHLKENGEEAVILSLAISVGMVLLAFVGFGLWRILAPVTEIVFGLNVYDIR